MLVGLAITGVSVSTSVSAAPVNCRAVTGTLVEKVEVPPPAVQTVGEMTGNLIGKYHFVVDNLPPVETPTPGIIFFTGTSSLENGEGVLKFSDAITTSVERPGNFSSYMSILGGSGKYSDASGYLHLYGNVDLVTGYGQADYKGTVCTPIE